MYEKQNEKNLRDINIAAKKVAEKLSIADRVEKMQETEAYITIKDHKDKFPNKMPCHLINPSKSSIGKISKAILDTINKNAVRSTEIKQWKIHQMYLTGMQTTRIKTKPRLFNLTMKIFIRE